MIILICLVALLICILYMVFINSLRKLELKYALGILDEILDGNLHRRIFNKTGRGMSELFIRINKLVMQYHDDTIRMKNIEQANQQLMTNLAHDLKTPATTLSGYLDALKEADLSEQEREKYIEISCEKADLLREYIEINFEWFQLYSREKVFFIESQDINEITRNALCSWIEEFERNGFTYRIEINERELYVKLDKRAYIRVVNNIVQNAIRHSGGNKIIVRIWDEEEAVFIAIEDNGNGLRAEEHLRIFERHYRCEEAEKRAGTGLGLAIVNEIMKAHGGQVAVDSILREFTRFTLRLPKN